MTPTLAAKVATRVAQGKTKAQVAAEFGVSVRTVYRALSERVPHPRVLKPCGTNAAYARHLRHHEKPCPPCCEAHARSVWSLAHGVKPR